MHSAEPLLVVDDLWVRFQIDGQPVAVVRQVDFVLSRGRTLCLVGESGCGKSVTAMAILGLLPRNGAATGSARFDGIDLVGLPERAMRSIRGARIGTIFQEPMSSLNPTMTVGAQIAEVLRIHLGLSRRAARARAIELLDIVRIPRARDRVDDYPFVFSGGMRQRVMIALALACSPDLLIADEPTTALDVTVQAEILDLLEEVQRQTGTALLMITHDLGVVAQVADEVAVMYAGSIVEYGRTGEVFEVPEHPYTIGLLGALPGIGQAGRLTPITGKVPSPAETMAGCRFAPRCPFVVDRCRESAPVLSVLPGSHRVACWSAPLEVPA